MKLLTILVACGIWGGLCGYFIPNVWAMAGTSILGAIIINTLLYQVLK